MNLQKFALDDLSTGLASDMTSFANRPVRLVVKGEGQEAEKVFGDAKPSSSTIQIDLSPAILSKIRNKRPGEKIWRGMAYYRLVNRLYPADSQLKVARQDGLASLFHLLNDEQNQRLATAKDRRLGSVFQTLCACVFRADQAKRTDVPVIGVAGSGETATGFDRAPQYVFRLNQFAYFLRRGLAAEECNEAVVVEALGLVPENLKELSKDQLLTLTRSIHLVLSRDVKLPPAPTKAAVSSLKDDVLEDIDVQEEEGEEEEEVVKPTDPSRLKGLLTNKWSYVTLASFIMFWLILLVKAGMGLWMTLAASVIVLAFGGAVFGVLMLFLNKKEKERRKREGAPERPAASGGGSWLKLSVTLPPLLLSGWFWAAVAGVIGLVIIEMFLPVWLAVLIGLIVFGAVTGVLSIKVKFNRQVERADGSIEIETTNILRELLSIPGKFWAWFTEEVWEPLSSRFMEGFRSFRRNVAELKDNVCKFFEDAFKSETFKHFTAGVSTLFSGLSAWGQRAFTLMWRHSNFRLFILALPVAMLIALFYGFVMLSSELVIWQLVMLGVLWLVCIGLAYIYRNQLKAWVIADVHTHQEIDHTVQCRLPVDKDTTGFKEIGRVEAVDADPKFLGDVKAAVGRVAQPLRDSLRRCGYKTVDRDNQAEGFDLIDELELAALGETDIFVGDREKRKASLHVHVVIDCSDSQKDKTAVLSAGEKFLRSRVMGLAFEEAVQGKRGISARFWGFNDDTIFDCGGVGEGRLSGLKITGGNNDAAALFHVSQNAPNDKSLTVVVMISDSQPADCSWRALRDLGWELTRRGIVVIQLSTEPCEDPALYWHFVDLHSQGLVEAATYVGNILETRLGVAGN